MESPGGFNIYREILGNLTLGVLVFRTFDLKVPKV